MEGTKLRAANLRTGSSPTSLVWRRRRTTTKKNKSKPTWGANPIREKERPPLTASWAGHILPWAEHIEQRAIIAASNLAPSSIQYDCKKITTLVLVVQYNSLVPGWLPTYSKRRKSTHLQWSVTVFVPGEAETTVVRLVDVPMTY